MKVYLICFDDKSKLVQRCNILGLKMGNITITTVKDVRPTLLKIGSCGLHMGPKKAQSL